MADVLGIHTPEKFMAVFFGRLYAQWTENETK